MPPEAHTQPQEAERIEMRRLRSFDGTEISYQSRGAGPTIVLANGLGAFGSAWRYQHLHFSKRYRLIGWDFRGLYRSGKPTCAGQIDIEHQARDLKAVLDAENIDKAVFIGWSMGTQVNLELYRLCPERFHGLVFIAGTAGRPFDTAFGGYPLNQSIAPLLAAMEAVSPVVTPLLQTVTHSRVGRALLHRLGALATRVGPAEAFVELAREWSEQDLKLYVETFRRLGEHDAFDVLRTIAVPTLLLAGDKDLLTPLSVYERLCAEIPKARLEVIRGGTHFSVINQSEQVNRVLSSFLSEISWGNSQTLGVS